MISKLSIESKKRNELIDITDELEKYAPSNGIITVYVPHTTAAVTVNEGADPSVKEDILKKLEKLAPPNEDYSHAEGNSDSHIKATLVGPAITLIIKEHKLVLGTWQRVFFCEFDGPRRRKIFIKT